MQHRAALALFALSCGSEALEFESAAGAGGVGGEPPVSETGAGASAGLGGGGSTIGAAGEAGGGGSAGQSGYLPGGYAGSQDVTGEDGSRITGDAGYFACVGRGEGWVSAFVYQIDTCTAGSLCTPSCGSDADCPTLPGAPAPACRPTLLGDGGPQCSLPCEADPECPEGMRCLEESRFARSCMFVDTPWAAECPPP
jgi:hypothetical protein